ncbi:unnamed protein product [Linum tenue]|uniref:Uncharacterized protein n=1 Tax=Linum tenue TaxID=586396 RepID=A0AAV0H596_9ROSI|nr:unnamed protein product [Linum tenue]
MQVTSVVFP